MSDRHRRVSTVSLSKFLQLGEYGLFLAVIPGTILAVLTGQCAFAISPITVSLWFNLMRRSQCDRSIYQRMNERDQEAVHRFESVAESVRRDRVDFLMAHAGQLQARDLPQCAQLLAVRLEGIENNQDSLASFLHESANLIVKDISAIDAECAQQRQQLDRLYRQVDLSLNGDADVLSSLDEQYEHLKSRVQALEWLIAEANQMLLNRVSVIENFCTQRGAEVMVIRESNRSQLLAQWHGIQNDIVSRLDGLAQQPIHLSGGADEPSAPDLQRWENCLDAMQQSLSEALTGWQTRTCEQRYKLQRLQDKLQKVQRLQRQLDDDSWEHECDLEDLSREVAEQCSQLDVITTQVTQSLAQAAQDVHDLQSVYDALPPFDMTESIQHATEDIEAKIRELSPFEAEPGLERDRVIDRLTQDSQSLQQHIIQCERRLSEIQMYANDAIADQLSVMEAALYRLSAEVDVALTRLNREDDAGDLEQIHIQLSMVRIKLEEIDTSVNLSLQQIPFLVESHIRERLSKVRSSTVASNVKQ